MTHAFELDVEIADTLEQIEHLQPSWEAMCSSGDGHEASFYQAYGWCRLVAQVRLRRSADRYRLCTAVVRRGGVIVAIWPLSLQKASRVWILRNLDAPFGQFAGIVCVAGEDLGPVVAAVVDAVRRRRLADAIQIENVRAGSPHQRALAAAGARSRVTNEAVVVDLTNAPTFQCYLSRLSAKHRKNVRNLRNRLGRHGDLEHVVTRCRERIVAIMQGAVAERLEWMQHFGRTTQAMLDADFESIVEALPSATDVPLIGFELRLGGATLSQQWGFVHDGRYYSYISARNRRQDHLSPGRAHLALIVEACHREGLSAIELNAPASDYKLAWSKHRLTLTVEEIDLTMAGRIYLRAVVNGLLPAMRRVSRTFPEAVRRPAVALFNNMHWAANRLRSNG